MVQVVEGGNKQYYYMAIAVIILIQPRGRFCENSKQTMTTESQCSLLQSYAMFSFSVGEVWSLVVNYFKFSKADLIGQTHGYNKISFISRTQRRVR